MIPFNRPSLEGGELDNMFAAVAAGHIAASGPFSARVTECLRSALGASDVLLTSSCTDALELAALMLDLGPDDVVIVPSFTFVSTALAFARTGARIRFVDIEPKTLGVDPERVAAALDDRVRAVVVVHYAGIGCDIDGVRSALADMPAVLVEDNAHGLYGTYRGSPLGSFGRFATLSFHETKNFVCGEGGALVLNEDEDIERAHVLLDKGTNRRSFLRGDVDQYTWVDTGSSFGISDLLAAFLLGQLEAKDVVLQKRQAIFDRYSALLEPYEDELSIQSMRVPDDRRPAYHMFYVLLPSQHLRDRVLESLTRGGASGVPLRAAAFVARGRSFSDAPAECPVTDDISSRLVRLPFYNALTPTDVEHVVDQFVQAVHTAMDIADV